MRDFQREHQVGYPLLIAEPSVVQLTESDLRHPRFVSPRGFYDIARMAGDYLFGDRVSAADCYLFVMLTWARKNHVPIPSSLSGFFTRMAARPCVIKALAHEGLNGSQSQAA